MKPLISCLMVTQPGRETTIRKALACFRRQTYEPRELVVVQLEVHQLPRSSAVAASSSRFVSASTTTP